MVGAFQEAFDVQGSWPTARPTAYPPLMARAAAQVAHSLVTCGVVSAIQAKRLDLGSQ